WRRCTTNWWPRPWKRCSRWHRATGCCVPPRTFTSSAHPVRTSSPERFFPCTPPPRALPFNSRIRPRFPFPFFPGCPMTTAALVLFTFALTALFATDVRPSQVGSEMGTIERKDPRFDKLIPPGAKLIKVAEGFIWVEGPVWVKDGGYLLFSDIPHNVVN